MAEKDPRVDAYIAKSAGFAKPILAHLRELVHRGCPEAEETVKWGMPCFQYKGSILCNMAAFKAHAVFGFWKGALIIEPGSAIKKGVASRSESDQGMGQFGRLASLKDLPSDKAMLGYIKAAMKLTDQGVKSPTRGKNARPKAPIPEPAYFLAALKRDKPAAAGYKGLSPSQQREYLEWITEAKTDATRDSRLATALEWMAEGKSRNWKYQRK